MANPPGVLATRWPATTCPWEVAGRSLTLGPRPWVMGIVNVTPDSFSDPVHRTDPAAAVDYGLKLVEEGAELLDIGGESTRPGARPVPARVQIARVVPVIESLAARSAVPLSVDTRSAVVAREAIAAGAAIINDISGLEWDPEMVGAAAATAAGVVCMHIQGTPETMQDKPTYGDVVAEVRDYLAHRLAALERAGIPARRVVLDPGIGFGKRTEHNLVLMAHLERFHHLGRPICIGPSRKGFIGKVLDRPIDQRVIGTVATALAAAYRGIQIIRVHDVGPVHDALVMADAIEQRAIRAAAPPAGAPDPAIERTEP